MFNGRMCLTSLLSFFVHILPCQEARKNPQWHYFKDNVFWHFALMGKVVIVWSTFLASLLVLWNWLAKKRSLVVFSLSSLLWQNDPHPLFVRFSCTQKFGCQVRHMCHAFVVSCVVWSPLGLSSVERVQTVCRTPWGSRVSNTSETTTGKH